ncbi:MAG: type II toxin-antitoxin system VapC family toxin [Paracraurococcus sp.]
MSLVLDTSVALSWQFEDEQTPATRAVLAQVTRTGAVVPSLWRLEVASALQTAVRRKRLAQAGRDAAVQDLAMLEIELDIETDIHAWGATLALADRFNLTPYDAAYLELALRRGLPLATLDRALRQAAGASGVALLGQD